jgi:uncharacterized protein YggE
VTNVLAVTVRALDTLPALLDDALLAGGESVVLHGIEFDVEKRRELERGALEAAVGDARARAETLAAAAGARLGTVVSIDARERERGAGPVPRMAMMAERAAATPVEAGSIEVEVTVDVTYAITPG